jgi:hypothetical protein
MAAPHGGLYEAARKARITAFIPPVSGVIVAHKKK